MDLFRTKLTKHEVPEVGEVWLRRPSAGMARRIANIQAGSEPEAAKGFALLAEAIASCWVHPDGKPVVADSDAALEMDSDAFARIGKLILSEFAPRSETPEQAEKNS
jgi:hypothetical protein